MKFIRYFQSLNYHDLQLCHLGSECQKDHMELLMVIKGHEVQTIRLQVRKTRPREKRLTQGHITANSRARSEHNPKCFSFIIIWESLL